MKRTTAVILIATGLALSATACNSSNTHKANKAEQNASGADLAQFLAAQPVPAFKWSQLRQTLIEIETARSKTTATTTFFFNQGVTDPIQTCPSIGFPIASTTELTNPQQIQTSNGNPVTIGQLDPDGVYAGASSGTYVLCVGAGGKAYADYWEGFVQTVTGPAVWDAASHSVKVTGPSSIDFTTTGK